MIDKNNTCRSSRAIPPGALRSILAYNQHYYSLITISDCNSEMNYILAIANKNI